MKKALLVILALSLAFPASAFRLGPTGVVNAVPYVIYNSTYGLYYGVIGKGKDFSGRQESLTLAAWLISNGGNGANFILSLPDDDYRHGKMFGLAFDLTGAMGRTISERYYGLGSATPGAGYTTADNVHNKLTFQFSRALSTTVLAEADFYVAANDFSNIIQGADPLTPQLQAAARNYSGGSLKLTLDKRDQSLDPHAGVYLIGNMDFGLSSADYVKGGLDFRAYHTPFAPDQVLAARLMLQQAGGSKIPLYEYPFLGGKDTMRGYTMNRWRDLASALVNVEYRFPLIWRWFQAVVFYEAGKVGDRLASLGLDNWAGDHGLGLHLNLGGNVIVRGDLGRGAEGDNVYFFYNQAF